MTRRYESIAPLTRADAEREFASGDSERMVRALVAVTENDVNWEWVESRCLQFLESPITDLRDAAILCLGHLARIHHKLNKDKVLPALERHRDDADASGRIDDALDDIEMFVRG